MKRKDKEGIQDLHIQILDKRDENSSTGGEPSPGVHGGDRPASPSPAIGDEAALSSATRRRCSHNLPLPLEGGAPGTLPGYSSLPGAAAEAQEVRAPGKRRLVGAPAVLSEDAAAERELGGGQPGVRHRRD